MRTTRSRRAPGLGRHASTGGRVHKTAKRLFATAGIATVAVVGSGFTSLGTTPAHGSNANQITTASQVTTASQITQETVAAVQPVRAAVSPKLHVSAKATTVVEGHYLDLTATGVDLTGAPLVGQQVTLQRHDRAWVNVATTTFSSAGSGKFHIKISSNNQFRVTVSPTVATAATTSTAPASTAPAASAVPASPAPAAPVAAAATAPAVSAVDAPVSNVVNIKAAFDAVAFGRAVVAEAARHKGAPYVFGADGPRTFDCSGLVKYVFARWGIILPHHANDMKNYGVAVSATNARPGDLVFVLSGSFAYHVAIYAGHGMWWEAPHPGASVQYAKLSGSHLEFRRILPSH